MPPPGQQYKGTGEAFQEVPSRLRCTLLARWEPGYTDPWLVLTDLPPEQAEVCWYGLRAWIEQGFKRLKSGGWDWQKTHMADPQRAERLWLVMAVATWWCLRVGGEAEARDLPVETIAGLPQATPARVPRPASPPAAPGEAPAGTPKTPPARVISVFVRGRTAIVNTLLRDRVLLLGRTLPEPWPTTVPGARSRASPAA